MEIGTHVPVPQQVSYGAEYYRSYCGIDYNDRDYWMEFFDGIAWHIINEHDPGTVLDVGCAYGYLVECLRNRGVDAIGIDTSGYALSRAALEVRPYLHRADALLPFPGRYDVIVCIEVVEHMDAIDGEIMIANLCAHTDAVFFSSTPDGYDQPGHMNVQPLNYWWMRFVKHGMMWNRGRGVTPSIPWSTWFERWR
jgi:2-polyprenyl-3-methyl-5-hydroxy-6-metoxy-1,4-benzoquinol methylase